MSDVLSPEKRSWNMSRIRGADTSIEVKVRRALFKEGFRFRKNMKSLPGKPDIVLPKYKTVIFVHGCFWHRHPGCKDASMPKTRVEFWKEKFARNIENDIRNKECLENMGWQVIIIWECEVNSHFDDTMNSVVRRLHLSAETQTLTR